MTRRHSHAAGAAPQAQAPDSETDRLAALHRLRLLDRPALPALDRVTRIAARLLGVPVTLISLVDEHRQYFKSRVGTDLCGTARDISFCTHAVAARQILAVPDALQDARFRDNPLVTAAPFIRAYLGVPLMTHDAQAIGTLCAIDYIPRTFSAAALQDMMDCAHIIEDLLHGRELMAYANTLPVLASA